MAPMEWSIFPIVLGMTVWWLIVLVEAVRVPVERWEAIGKSKRNYVVLMVCLGVIGTIAYIDGVRPLLRASGALKVKL